MKTECLTLKEIIVFQKYFTNHNSLSFILMKNFRKDSQNNAQVFFDKRFFKTIEQFSKKKITNI